jgi:hypothetical protein
MLTSEVKLNDTPTLVSPPEQVLGQHNAMLPRFAFEMIQNYNILFL